MRLHRPVCVLPGVRKPKDRVPRAGVHLISILNMQVTEKYMDLIGDHTESARGRMITEANHSSITSRVKNIADQY